MTRKTFFRSLGAVLLLLLVVVYMGYQVMENLTEKIITADALEITAQDKVSTTGIFVRQETPLYSQQGGAVAFLAGEGEKVARGQAVALRRHLKQVDPHAFMIVANSSEIFGKGFLRA